MILLRTVFTLALTIFVLNGAAFAQLSGSYDIGGGNNNYATINDAVTALQTSGISDAVTFNVYGGDYAGQVHIFGPIAGASASDTIKFVDASGTARITCATYLGATDGALMLDSVSYLIFDGIDVLLNHPQDSTYKNMSLINGSSYNVIRNATFTGAGFTGTAVKYGVYIWSNECNFNTFDNVHITRAKTAVRISGFTGVGLQPTGNTFQNMTMDNVWTGFYVATASGTHIRDNDIQLNGTSNTGSTVAYGLHVDTQGQAATDTVFFYRNTVHNLVVTGSNAGMVRANPGADQVVRIFNNFAYDFQLSGAAQARGISAEAGIIEIYHNSIKIGAFTTTANFNPNIYTTSGTTGVYRIKNNILANDQTVHRARNIYFLLDTPVIELDYNNYFGCDTVVYLDVHYLSVDALNAATGFEEFGIEGDPGFTFDTDLHILDTVGTVHNNGTPIAGIADDIDGDPRNSCTPDIGADEYVYLAPAEDYRVRELVGAQALYPELATVNVDARVQNNGSAAQVDVPVRLLYNGVQADEILVSLTPGECDTITFTWNTPAAPSSGVLEAQSYLAGDAVPGNDSATADVIVVGQPMHGSYDIGGGLNTYPTFGAAVTDLTLRGVDGAVTFNVYAATYNENLSIPAITGASAINTITFIEAGALDTPPEIVSGTSPAVNLDGADYITFDNIDISLTVTGRAVQVTNDADYNTIRNCSIAGATVSGTTNYGVYVVGGGNDNNTFENLSVSGGYYGIRMSGTSGGSDIANEVDNCSITEAKYGIYVEYQNGARVHNCDIQPGWASAATEIYGIYAAAHGANDSSYAYANEIHNLRVASGANAANGIYGTTGATGGRLLAYNNFIYDYQVAGTGAVYGLRLAGGIGEFYFNSVLINNVSTTGGTIGINGFYQAGATSTATLVNNILELDEATAAARAIYRSAGTLTSNYNAVYNGGANAAYNMGRDLAVEYATLAAWQAGTGRDANSVQGDPGFTSSTNLHIQPSFSLVNDIANPVAGITTDIDGDARAGTPDIGADEYSAAAFAHDYGVISFVGLLSQYNANSPYTIQADIQNNGGSNETNVPIVLYYNGTPQDTALLSLAAGAHDTVDLSWTTPNVGFQNGTLEVQVFCPGDGYADNDSVTAQVAVIGGPMSGTYDLGGGNMDFANFSDAVTSLNLRGIDGPVIIDCYDGTYNESLIFTPINGASFTDRVTFQAHQDPLADVVILTDGVAPRVVYFNDADFITFDGIDIVASGATNFCAELDNNSDYITLENLSVTSRDSTILGLANGTNGIRINFDGNDYCTVDNVVVRGAGYGILCQGGSGQSDNLEVKNCDISGASYGVYLDDCHNARVHDNEIQPHGYASTSAYGVYVASLTADDTAYVYSNRIHNFRHTSLTGFALVAGINAGSNETVYAYNNFIWDWQTNGPDIAGLYSSIGTTYWYHNSVRMNDVAAADEFSVFHNGAGSAVLLNNIFVIEETIDTCYGIWREGGTLTGSNYNCIYGPGAGFRIARDGASEFATLPDWQAFGYDLNSISGDPGFQSASDLHIDPTFTLCESAGTAVPEVTTDIDGDVRNNPPDIGADEYEAQFAPDPVTDLAVLRDGVTDDVILHWSATTNANSYLIYAGNTPDFVIEPASQIGTTAATSFTHAGTVPANAKLFYVVIASTAPAASAE